jgi:hypothetical protein
MQGHSSLGIWSVYPIEPGKTKVADLLQVLSFANQKLTERAKK